MKIWLVMPLESLYLFKVSISLKFEVINGFTLNDHNGVNARNWITTTKLSSHRALFMCTSIPKNTCLAYQNASSSLQEV